MNPKKFLHNVHQKKSKKTFFLKKTLSFGNWGLSLNTSFLMSSNFLFSMTMFMKKATKSSEKTLSFFWISSFPNQPLTKKVQGSSMGKGKGKRISWGILLNPGCVLYELKNLSSGSALYFLSQLVFKLPANVSMLSNSHFFTKIYFRSFYLM